MKKTILTILLCLFYSALSGQETRSYNQRLYDTYVDYEILEWKGIIEEMRDEYSKTKDRQLLYDLCFAEYGFVGHCIGQEDDKRAKGCMNYAIKDVKKLEKVYRERHDVLALQGAFYGFQIMLSKFSALYLAPKTFKLIKTASASSDTYFNCSMEIGNMRYFTPDFLGGSKEEAIAYYENAVKLAQRDLKEDEPSWLYINTMLLLANAYCDTGSVSRGRSVYEQILEYEPDADWIRKEMARRCK